jgi:protein polybromo-1
LIPSNTLIIRVLPLQDYFKLQPEGVRPEDVYVCESRYSARNKAFKKIKLWAVPAAVRFVPRDVPLPVVRVASMYAKRDQEKLLAVADNGSRSIVDKVRGLSTGGLFILE